jgi:phosphatidylglycerol:prolipoprotein diacylglycerol transferase
MLVIAFLVSSYLAKEKARSIAVNPEIIFNLSFIALIFGIIGSRLLYVIFNLDYYVNNPLEIIKLWHGGLSWFGGVFLGSVVAIIYIRKNKLSVYRTLDLLMPFLALGQSIGRIGCLLNGCCYGKESTWGLYFPVHNRVLIPTQIFSSLALLVIFLILRIMQDRIHKDAEILFTYLILYSVKRFLIEFWRRDNEIAMLGLTYFQIISLVILFISAYKLILIKRSRV